MSKAMLINPLAQQGFTAGAAAYERGRPSYPPDAFAWIAEGLGLRPGLRILDLAAGTGKFTRLLAAVGAEIVAVEPVAAMRSQFAAVLPRVPISEGTAEQIPLGDASVMAVTVAQSFHWFEAPRALAEISRVLQPGGGLALIWNERDESVPWVAELGRRMRWDVQMPYPVGMDWCPVLERSGLFTGVRRQRFRFDQSLDQATLLERVASTSYIAAMAQAERAALLDCVRSLVAALPEPFSLPYVTDAYVARRA